MHELSLAYLYALLSHLLGSRGWVGQPEDKQRKASSSRRHDIEWASRGDDLKRNQCTRHSNKILVQPWLERGVKSNLKRESYARWNVRAGVCTLSVSTVHWAVAASNSHLPLVACHSALAPCRAALALVVRLDSQS